MASRASGFAEGALAGMYPDPGLGVPCSAGMVLWDDFMHSTGAVVAARHGDMFWTSTTINVTASTFSSIAPTSATMCGILQQAQAATTANAGSASTLGTVASFYRAPAPGTIFVVKKRMTLGGTNYTLWSGFTTAVATIPTVAGLVGFVGIRSVGGNLFGVVKNAAGGAGNESTVDFGFTCAGAVFRTCGFEVSGTLAARTIQFFYVGTLGASTDDTQSTWGRVDVGAPLSANWPAAAAMFPTFGMTTSELVAKTAQWDFWGVGGRSSR